MNFLAPGAFFLGLLLPVIVAFYLLKLRRVEQSVPSVYLWRRMVRDVEANAPWQRLRFNLLMLLQLLFLAALIMALTRPFTWVEGAGGQAAILILDTSASMSATDVAPNRLESAKLRARQLVDDLPDSARITVIDAGREAQVKLSSSLDRRQAHQAIAGLTGGTGGSDMGVALELASAIAARQPGTEIFVLSDGQVSLPEHMALKGKLRYIPFGLSDENQAISLLTLDLAQGGQSLTAFAQVSNYSQSAASRRLLLYADSLLVNAFDLPAIPPGGQTAVLAEGLPLDTRTITAQLDGSDILSLDDRALAVKPHTQTVHITLVSSNNLFLKAAANSLPGVTLNQVDFSAPLAQPTPAETAAPTPAPSPDALADETTADLTIYDANVPDILPSQGSLLFIAPPRSSDLFTVTGQVDTPTPRSLDPNDPLLAHVSLAGINILDSTEIALPNWAIPVVGGDLLGGQSIPLLFRGEVDGRRVAVLAFDLHHSDLPLNIAFPLLWSNLIDWLIPGARSAVPVQVSAGENITFQPPAGTSSTAAMQSAAITRPDGSTVQIQAENGQFLYADTSLLGHYEVDFGGGNLADFAVNLFSPQESSLKPADFLPGVVDPSGEANASSQLGQHEWWRPLAMLALGLLVGEWLVYQRAALSRLRDFMRVKGLRHPALKGPK